VLDAFVSSMSATPTGTRTSRRLESLTGLRWFAALAVFSLHAIGAPAAHHLVTQGATGVSFFFILSGFVLTWSHRAEDRARPFYRRRFARIYPAFFVSVLLGIWIQDSHVTVGRLLQVLTLQQDWSTHNSTFFAFNGVCWSLACEAFFYLLFPFVIGPLSKLTGTRRRIALASVIALALAVQLGVHPHSTTGTGYWLVYIFPPVRFLEFLCGMLLALELRAGTRLPIGLRTALVVAVLAYAAAGVAPDYAKYVAVTLIPYSLLIFTAASADADGLPSWLRHRRLVWLGEISFAFYLVHQLVIDESMKLLARAGIAYHSDWAIPILVISVLAAWLLFALVERPFERRLRPGHDLPVSAGGTGHLVETG
jgi:peptidoglycan/LPS O-acetylase OafA/YrhL